MAATKATQNRVKATMIVVKVGGRDRYLDRGALVPSQVEAAEVKRLLASGLVEKVTVQSKPQSKPTGSGKGEAAGSGSSSGSGSDSTGDGGSGSAGDGGADPADGSGDGS